MSSERKLTRPFADFLRDHRGGALHDEISLKLAQVAQGVSEHDKAGSITIKISVTKRPEDSYMTITDDVKHVVPEKRGGMIAWADDEGNLFKHDPRQQQLELERVRLVADDQPVRIDTETGEVVKVASE